MDTHEIVQKIRNKQGNYEDLLKWCEEHIDKIDLNDKYMPLKELLSKKQDT